MTSVTSFHHKTLWLIGSGHMGSAILGGLPESIFEHNQWLIVDHHAPQVERWKHKGKTCVASDLNDYHERGKPDYVILAVKPQDLGDVIRSLQEWLTPDTVLISIAAGKTISFIEGCVPFTLPIIRTMPNLPALIGKGVTVACANEQVLPEQKDIVQHLLQAIGHVYWVEQETLLNAVTALSGSGPAYVFHFTECLIKAGLELGLPQELATNLALHTVAGSAALPVETNQDVSTLRVQVTSPKGTTEAALNVLMAEDGLSRLVSHALKAACQRAAELAQ
ncbi:MAG: pyrroline-5-carboxylate reductase [Alphaproteobacteria bacterium]|nr:pyrroline-5-carboxylate reductase [Alphaproteobacteria bacterium]